MASCRQGLTEPPPGTFILHAEPDELLLDLDTAPQVRQFVDRLEDVAEWYGVKRISIWPSRNGNTHAVVVLEKKVYDSTEKYLLQAVLGSDPLRELLNHYDLTRYDLVSGHVNVLFKPDVRADESD